MLFRSKPHGNRSSLAFVLAVQHDLLALTLEILTRESVTGAAQVQRDAFDEAFTELDTFMETERSKGHIIEIAEMVVEALRPVAQQLGQLASTPLPEPEPPNQLPLASSGVASSSTAQSVGVDPEQELRAGDDGVTPERLPSTSSGAVPSSEIEGVLVTADIESAPPTGSATGSSPTSPNESSYPSHSLTPSSEHTGRDPATLV